MPVGRTPSAVSWAESHSRTEPAGSRTGCKRRPGGSKGSRKRRDGESTTDMAPRGFGRRLTANSRRGNGNPRNYDCCRRDTACRREASKLLAAFGRGHNAVLYVGVPNLSERHFSAPPEIDF